MAQGRKTGRKQHRKDDEGSREMERGESHAGQLVKGVHLLPTLRGYIKSSENKFCRP